MHGGVASHEEGLHMMQILARNWWALALRGGFAVVFGLLALFMPALTLKALILLFAAYAIVDGVLSIVFGVRAARRQERWVAFLLEGILGIAAGAAAFFVPAAAALAFVFLFG